MATQNSTEIANEFMKLAPPGELKQVYNDLKGILKTEEIDNAQETALNHHKENLTSVFLDIEKQKRYLEWLKIGNTLANRKADITGKANEFANSNGDCLVTVNGHVDGTTFYDPKSQQYFDFDPLTQFVSNVREATDYPVIESTEPLRKALTAEAEIYATKHYYSGVSAIYTVPNTTTTNGNKEFAVLIDGHDFVPANKINAKWRSKWLVTIKADKKILVQGGMEAHIHYYEDSNVQLVAKQQYDEPISIEGLTHSDSDLKLAEDIITTIKRLESKYQKNVRRQVEDHMDAVCFKKLRLRIPFTKKKLDWENIAKNAKIVEGLALAGGSVPKN